MIASNELLLSDLLHHNVRCDKGINHGLGVMAWMHPPIHRILGWASRPSTLRLLRNVWRLDQLKGINAEEVFVKGLPAESDQATLDRFPTLLDAHMINRKGEKIALIADFVFDVKTGNILYYLVSRSNPKIPGTSRWRLSINNIEDQQPGLVFTEFLSLDDLPIVKSSLRQDILRKSKKLRDQFDEISLRANNRLEGWLEELPWDENDYSKNSKNYDFFDQWEDNINSEVSQEGSSKSFSNYNGDPWI
ncbi:MULTISPECIES: hypothetical protein [Prochlorococcus]|uniref:hypothetical protein n=1 Tax=Prochlorococcus TaxID=1218 RepID=UPI00053394C9|nr:MULTISPECIES: hypothetical protein [Prochlorococcus]KGG13758.1 RNA metabolism-related protein [Prochlorococcus sp. MIT 0601]